MKKDKLFIVQDVKTGNVYRSGAPTFGEACRQVWLNPGTCICISIDGQKVK